MPKTSEQPTWPRLEVYVPSDTVRRRVKAAAAAQDVKVSAYCLDAILERLERDEQQSRSQSADIVSDLHAWHAKALAQMGGKRLSRTSDTIRKIRKERTNGLAGLH